MMALNDALVKVDGYLEGVLKKVERQIFELDPNQVIKIETSQGKSSDIHIRDSERAEVYPDFCVG